MKTMNDYLNELRVSMKRATPAEATARLIQEANAEWAAQCKRTWNPDYTKEVLNFMKTAKDEYGVNGFKITDANVAHECMRDDLKCLGWLDIKLLTPEYVETLRERDSSLMHKIFSLAKTEPELIHILLTPEYITKQLDRDADLFESLPDCYSDDLELVRKYLPKVKYPMRLLKDSCVEKAPELAISMMEREDCYIFLGTGAKSMDVIVRYMLEHYPKHYADAPAAVRRNEEYALIAIEKDRRNMYWVPLELKEKKPFVREAVKVNREFFSYASKKLRYEPDFCISLIKDDAEIINLMDDDMFDAMTLYDLYKENQQIAFVITGEKRKVFSEYANKIGDKTLAAALDAERKEETRQERAERRLKELMKRDTSRTVDIPENKTDKEKDVAPLERAEDFEYDIER